MATTLHVPTLAALGGAAGAAIGRHLDRAFRAMIREGRRTEGPQFLRLLTGELHPFGNLALLSAPVDLDATREVVDPLVAAAVPAAVIFPDLDVTVDVDAYLGEQGFTPHAPMPAMGIGIASLTPTVLPDGYELVRVGHGDDGEEWER